MGSSYVPPSLAKTGIFTYYAWLWYWLATQLCVFDDKTDVWVEIFEKTHQFVWFEIFYHRLANRKRFILALEKYFKTLNDMTIDGTVGTERFESFTTFQMGWNNGVEIWVFDATGGISRAITLPLILILQMK